MSATRDIAAFGSLSPLLIVEDVRQAVDFYTQVLGFTHVASDAAANGTSTRAELIFPAGGGGGEQPRAPFLIMLASARSLESTDKTWLRNAQAGPRGRGVVHWVYVDDVEGFEAAVRSAGANVLEPLGELLPGERGFTVADPDGHRWTFSTAR